MRPSKLIHFLDLLSPAELRELHRFLESGIFQAHKDLPRLLEELEKHIIRLKTPRKTEAEIFAAVWPTRGEFDQNHMRKAKTALLEQVFEFLRWKEFQADTAARNRYLLSSLNRRGEDKYFGKLEEDAGTELDALPRSPDWLDEKMKLQVLRVQYLNRGARKGGIEEYDALEEISVAQTQVRTYSVLSMVNSLTRSAQGRVRTLPQPIALTGGMAGENWLLDLYYLSAELLSDRPEIYLLVKSLLHTYSDKISGNEREDFYGAMLNFCIRKINLGEKQYRSEALNIYRQILASGILTENGYFSHAHFKNIVSLACASNQLEWAAAFIQEKAPDLQPSHQKLAILYNQAIIAFYLGQYGSAEKGLNQVLEERNDIFYALDSRNYLLRIYYLTRNEIGMESLELSFRKYVERNKSLSNERKKLYFNQLKLYRNLFNLNLNDKSSVQKFYSELLQKKHSGNISWILEELEKKLQ